MRKLLALFMYAHFLFFTIACKKEDNVIIKYIYITKPEAVSLKEIKNITETSVVTGGIVSSDGGSPIIAKGVCWSLHESPTIDDNVIIDSSDYLDYTIELTSLTPNKTYYIRAYATNDIGTTYSSISTFQTLNDKLIVKDIDGNNYEAIKIGTQTWMTSNLKVTRFNDGTPLLNLFYGDDWIDNIEPAYNWYRSDSNNYGKIYGALYNGYVVDQSKNGGKNICPVGWHIPSNDEWNILIDYLGGKDIAGGKLKVIGAELWQNPNIAATNESGFSALPGGYRTSNGPYRSINRSGLWWTSSKDNDYSALLKILINDSKEVSTVKDYYFLNISSGGYSIRCVKD